MFFFPNSVIFRGFSIFILKIRHFSGKIPFCKKTGGYGYHSSGCLYVDGKQKDQIKEKYKAGDIAQIIKYPFKFTKS